MPILTSHKNAIYYVEYCRIVAKDTRLSFIKSENSLDKSFSLPHLNLSVLLLGPGTSITQQAAKLLSSEGVMVGFTSGGGSPLFLASNSEYRPTEYLQKWILWWPNEQNRLEVGKSFQEIRVNNIQLFWKKFFGDDVGKLQEKPSSEYRESLKKARNTEELLGYEATATKQYYRALSSHFEIKNFKREPRTNDYTNILLDQGNYVAYGLASVALWAMGIPVSLAVIHGKTRRGALVFDLADIYKDAIVLPVAFKAAYEGLTESQFRKELIDLFDKSNAVQNLCNIIKDTSFKEFTK